MLGICLALVGLHVAVVATLFPGSATGPVRVGMLLCAVLGVPVGLRWLAGASRLARSVALAVVGLGAMVAGLATSVSHAGLAGPGGSDVTGILATIAGGLLVGFGFREVLGGRRRAIQLVFGAVGVFVIIQWAVTPAVDVGLITNAPRPAVPSAATLGYAGARDVSFPAPDGVRLTGWYVPGRTRAAVILLHGSHGTRRDTLGHLRMLVAAGYGVLAFDARGHGQSAGQTNALGWSGASDVAGAVTFLRRQPGIDPRAIAALGLSMGAEEALRAAAAGVPLSAVIADGAGASTLADNLLLPHPLSPVFTSVTWLTMRGGELVSGEPEPAGLSRRVGRIRVPVLLIASSAPAERTIARIYHDRVGPRARLWSLPGGTPHTGGLSAHPAQYAAHAEAFLASALHRR